MNDSGAMAFTATSATDQADVPRLAVVRQEGSRTWPVATNLDEPPGQPGAKFEEFSAPIVFSDGNVLFGARWAGKVAGSGLFLWSPRVIQALPLPAGFQIGPKNLLEPFFVGHDEAAFLLRGVPPSVATEQVFRAIAIQSFRATATGARSCAYGGTYRREPTLRLSRCCWLILRIIACKPRCWPAIRPSPLWPNSPSP